jgi:hypothetical protein
MLSSHPSKPMVNERGLTDPSPGNDWRCPSANSRPPMADPIKVLTSRTGAIWLTGAHPKIRKKIKRALMVEVSLPGWQTTGMTQKSYVKRMWYTLVPL